MDSLPTELRFHTPLKEKVEKSSHSHAAKVADHPLDSQSDAKLIELFKTGSKEAMDTLYGRYKHLVLSISFKVLRDHTEAEDLVQDVFLEICKRVELYDATRGSVRMWILQYAYTRSFDRRKYLSHRHGIRNPSNGNGNGDGNHYRRESERYRSPSLCDWSILRERARIVCEVLETLPEKQRRIIGLVYFQGMLMKEVADQTGETLANVRQHYYRGLRKLRDELKRVLDGDGK